MDIIKLTRLPEPFHKALRMIWDPICDLPEEGPVMDEVAEAFTEAAGIGEVEACVEEMHAEARIVVLIMCVLWYDCCF